MRFAAAPLRCGSSSLGEVWPGANGLLWNKEYREADLRGRERGGSFRPNMVVSDCTSEFPKRVFQFGCIRNGARAFYAPQLLPPVCRNAVLLYPATSKV